MENNVCQSFGLKKCSNAPKKLEDKNVHDLLLKLLLLFKIFYYGNWTWIILVMIKIIEYTDFFTSFIYLFHMQTNFLTATAQVYLAILKILPTPVTFAFSDLKLAVIH